MELGFWQTQQTASTDIATPCVSLIIICSDGSLLPLICLILPRTSAPGYSWGHRLCPFLNFCGSIAIRPAVCVQKIIKKTASILPRREENSLWDHREEKLLALTTFISGIYCVTAKWNQKLFINCWIQSQPQCFPCLVLYTCLCYLVNALQSKLCLFDWI